MLTGVGAGFAVLKGGIEHMGKVLSIIIGLVFLALGIWGISRWDVEVLAFVKAAVAVMAVIVGLGIFIFGVSELRAGSEPQVLQPPAQPPSSGGSPPA